MADHLAKYIIIERDGEEFPILFPCRLQHSEMVPADKPKVKSAGFYQIISSDLLLVGGESMSLHVRARVEDEPLIKQLLVSAS